MDKIPITAEQIVNHVSERWKESVFRKENILVDFKLNNDGIIFLVFTNTGKRPVHLRKIKLSSEWIQNLQLIIPNFELEGRLKITLKEINSYHETIFPLQSVSFPLFHFYYTFKPWYIPSGNGEYNNRIQSEMILDEYNKLRDRQQNIVKFYQVVLKISFKISVFNIIRQTVYLRFNKRVNIAQYNEEIESGKFDNRGKRIGNN